MGPLLVGAAALLAALGATEGEVRRRRKLLPLESVFASIEVRGDQPPAFVVEQVEEAVASQLALVPALRPILSGTTLVIVSSRSGGWYLPSAHQIVIGWKDQVEVGVVTHEAFHALDMAAGFMTGDGQQWASWRPGSPQREVAEQAKQILREQITLYSDGLVLGQIRRSLPAALVERLSTGERFPATEAVAVVLEAHGRQDDPDAVVEAIQEARGPFGSVNGAALAKQYGADLARDLVTVATLMPIGIPLSFMGKSDAERRAWSYSVSIGDRIRDGRNYHLSLHEVYARLADQSMRRAAALHGLYLPSNPHLSADLDLSDSDLELVEPKLWETIRR